MLQQNKKTIATAIRDFPEWHRGRKEFTLWMIELEQDSVLQRVESVRKHLSGFLLTSYERQPHISLFVCGFLVEVQRFDDDYAAHQLDAHCRLLADSKIRPFSIEISGLNSFASAPFLQVYDRDGGIERIRAVLSNTVTEIERDTYTPHVTVGLYSHEFEGSVVLERIRTFAYEPLRLSVDRIAFAAFDPWDIRGPLRSKRQVKLGV
jgi:2'-5' RNA ligase